jgi:hypothetical protein
MINLEIRRKRDPKKHLLVVHCQLVSRLGEILSVSCGDSFFDDAHGEIDVIKQD